MSLAGAAELIYFCDDRQGRKVFCPDGTAWDKRNTDDGPRRERVGFILKDDAQRQAVLRYWKCRLLIEATACVAIAILSWGPSFFDHGQAIFAILLMSDVVWQRFWRRRLGACEKITVLITERELYLWQRERGFIPSSLRIACALMLFEPLIYSAFSPTIAFAFDAGAILSLPAFLWAPPQTRSIWHLAGVLLACAVFFTYR